MDPFKFQLLGVAVVLGSTISIILLCILDQTTPTPFTTVGMAFSWVVMIKLNPVWHDLWDKWTKK